MSAADIKVREVAPGFHLIHLPLPMRPTIVNVYLVDGGDEWALIDTGIQSDESLAAFRAALDLIGCAPERVRKIICTHHHPDHFGASQPHRELTGAQVYLHPLEAERTGYFLRTSPDEGSQRFYDRHGFPRSITTGIPNPGDFWVPFYAPAKPDVPLADGDLISVGNREIEVVWTPGHSPGHCVMFFRRERVVIVGDHLLPKITPHVGITNDAPKNPLGDFLASLQKVADLDADTVLPAHGAVFENPARRAEQLIEFHEYRMQVMLDIARRQPLSAWQIALEAFDLTLESPLTQLFPATFETLAHLEHMRLNGRTRSTTDGDTVLWRSVRDD